MFLRPGWPKRETRQQLLWRHSTSKPTASPLPPWHSTVSHWCQSRLGLPTRVHVRPLTLNRKVSLFFYDWHTYFCRNRNAPYMPAMVIVISSIVCNMRLMTASGLGGEKMKCIPRNSGGSAGEASQGGNTMASTNAATIPYNTWMFNCPGSDRSDGKDGVDSAFPSIRRPQCVQNRLISGCGR